MCLIFSIMCHASTAVIKCMCSDVATITVTYFQSSWLIPRVTKNSDEKWCHENSLRSAGLKKFGSCTKWGHNWQIWHPTMAQEYKTTKRRECERERDGKIETSTAIIVKEGNRKAVVQQWQMPPVVAPIDTEPLICTELLLTLQSWGSVIRFENVKYKDISRCTSHMSATLKKKKKKSWRFWRMYI